MLFIECPWCSFRDDEEFYYGGEAHVKRPIDPSILNDEEFSEYLFLKSNTKGLTLERWLHSQGCRRWFNVLRNTATNEIVEVYPIAELPSSAAGRDYHKSDWRRKSAAENGNGDRDQK
jgi:sarcosine oxidase subunit delta